MAKKRTTEIALSRKKKLPAYRTLRLSRRIKLDQVKKLPSVKVLWKETWEFLWTHKKKMLGFVLIYAVSYFIFVKGFNDFTIDTEELKLELEDLLQGNIGALITFITLYVTLLGSMNTGGDELTNFYQTFILVIFSLAFIWLLRKLHLRNSDATVKDAFYQGMRPLIPFTAVGLVMLLELIPAGATSLLLITAQSASSLASEAETLGFSVLAILGAVLSAYLIAGSLFSIYIVTLPNMTPMKALRSSMRLLRIHRWAVVRKIFGFIVLLVVLGFFLVLPFILWVPQYAEVAFFVMSCASFAVLHTFMYKLYRSML